MARATMAKTRVANSVISKKLKSKARSPKRASATKKPPAALRLYWCETEDHGEDWFILARSLASACRIHEDEEGYERGDADAELICELPSFLQKTAKTGWPSRAVLEACGGEILKGTGQDEQPRVVRINGRVFGEGDVFDLAKARLGKAPRH